MKLFREVCVEIDENDVLLHMHHFKDAATLVCICVQSLKNVTAEDMKKVLPRGSGSKKLNSVLMQLKEIVREK